MLFAFNISFSKLNNIGHPTVPRGSIGKETGCQCRGDKRSWEDPLEEEMATHSSILAWRIRLTEKHGGLRSMGWQRVGHD